MSLSGGFVDLKKKERNSLSFTCDFRTDLNNSVQTVSAFQCEAVDPADKAADKRPMSYGFATFKVPFAFLFFSTAFSLSHPPIIQCFYHNGDSKLHTTALKGFLSHDAQVLPCNLNYSTRILHKFKLYGL